MVAIVKVIINNIWVLSKRSLQGNNENYMNLWKQTKYTFWLSFLNKVKLHAISLTVTLYHVSFLWGECVCFLVVTWPVYAFSCDLPIFSRSLVKRVDRISTHTKYYQWTDKLTCVEFVYVNELLFVSQLSSLTLNVLLFSVHEVFNSLKVISKTYKLLRVTKPKFFSRTEKKQTTFTIKFKQSNLRSFLSSYYSDSSVHFFKTHRSFFNDNGFVVCSYTP